MKRSRSLRSKKFSRVSFSESQRMRVARKVLG